MYGLSFMRAVEEGAREWRENQSKLRARREAMRAQAERTDPRNLLPRSRTDHLAAEIDHGQDRHRTTYRTCSYLSRPTMVDLSWEAVRHALTEENRFPDYELSPERPPIVGYTGHIPGAKGEVALSKGYTQAAKKGLELIRKEREERHGRLKDVSERILDVERMHDLS